jgi:hypothetical protein
VVAITPVAGDSEWVTETTWSIARSVADTGRRTALIDLHLEDPELHARATRPSEAGIVDAFVFGASLQHVASQDENPNLHFIGVGTPTSEVDEVLENKRWERLSRGFHKEEALLLLFMPSSALDSLSIQPELIIALSPHGFGKVGPSSPQLRSARDRGVPVAVIIDPDAHDDGDFVSTADKSHRAKKKRLKGLLPLVGVVLSVVLMVAIAYDRLRDTNGLPTIERSGIVDTAMPSIENSIQEVGTEMPVVPTPTGPVDTLAYSIQVAAWAGLEDAIEHYTELADAGVTATISAVARDSERVWYRVFAGVEPTRSAAVQLRDDLRSRGIIGSVRGVLANTPFAYLLATHPDTSSALLQVEGLRESGIPAYIVSMPDGPVQVMFGAFESADQAALADSVLSEAGRSLSRVLVTRVGIAR